MTALSAQTIRKLKLVSPLREAFRDENGNSGGLGPCGYDLTLDCKEPITMQPGQFMLLSTLERFDLPSNVVCYIYNKSSLIRNGFRVEHTVAEPGWRGYLTLEVSNIYVNKILLHPGCAVAQAVFHFLDEPTELPYRGKYQDQERGPQRSR